MSSASNTALVVPKLHYCEHWAREEKLSEKVYRLELALDNSKKDLKSAADKAKNDLAEWKNKVEKRNSKIHDLNA